MSGDDDKVSKTDFDRELAVLKDFVGEMRKEVTEV